MLIPAIRVNSGRRQLLRALLAPEALAAAAVFCYVLGIVVVVMKIETRNITSDLDRHASGADFVRMTQPGSHEVAFGSALPASSTLRTSVYHSHLPPATARRRFTGSTWCHRGVPPHQQQQFCCAGEFMCLDRSRSIRCSRINDDYCDCSDGSDEPGEQHA
jgi:hypothetical protein